MQPDIINNANTAEANTIALLEVALEGDVKKLNALKIKNPNIDLNEIITIGPNGSRGWRAINFAIVNTYSTDFITALIENGANVNLPDAYCYTPLHQASASGRVDLVDTILSAGARVNSPNNDGDTALHFASERGHTEVAKLLLEKGADIKQKNKKGETPLQIVFGEQAPRPEHLITAKLLLEKGANLEEIGKKHELYPLLKILTKFTDDEIQVVAKNRHYLKGFKTISNEIISISKNLSEKELGAIIENSKDIIDSLPVDLKQRLGKDLTSKLVKNLLETLSPKTLQSAQSSQVVGSATEAPENPSSAMQAHKITKADETERASGRGGD